MGLFSTLQATATAGNASSNTNSNNNASSSSSSSLSVPTLIQLSTDHYQIALPPQVTNNTTNNTTDLNSNNSRTKKQQNLTNPIAHMPSWAALTYQTCIVDTSGMELGVWNCPLLTQDFFMPPKLTSNNTMSCRKFVMTIDLWTTASLVEPHITRIQQALVRYWIQQEPVETSSTSTTTKEQPETTTTDENTHATLATANNDDDPINITTHNETTSLQLLKTVQFGIANEDNDSTTTTSTTTLEEHDATTKMALLICAMVDSPPKNKNTTKDNDNDNDDTNTSLDDDDDDDDEESSYTRQQTQALLQYHLRKYAHALNCALVYVTDDDINTVGTTNPHNTGTVTVSQLAILWRAFALGQPIWKTAAQLLEVEEEQPTEAEQPESLDTPSSSPDTSASSSSSIIVHGPDAYQEDLLDSVLLRNAQYPGKWDAAKESLWKILPYEDSETMLVNNRNTTMQKQNDTAGDQSWLTELSQSMEVVDTTTSSNNKDASASMKSPAAAKTPGKKTTTKKTAEPATPGDAAAFFESLLK